MISDWGMSLAHSLMESLLWKSRSLTCNLKHLSKLQAQRNGDRGPPFEFAFWSTIKRSADFPSSLWHDTDAKLNLKPQPLTDSQRTKGAFAYSQQGRKGYALRIGGQLFLVYFVACDYGELPKVFCVAGFGVNEAFEARKLTPRLAQRCLQWLYSLLSDRACVRTPWLTA